jgi:hypothetical protein
MEYTEHPTGDGHKWVRFYLHDLPFETYTEEDSDPEFIISWRLSQLLLDYAKWGDYLHSDLTVEKLMKQDNGNENS